MMFDDEYSTNSEIVWSFKNVKRDLLRIYPTGQPLSDELKTTSGQTWLIKFYPNGKDIISKGKIDLIIELVANRDKKNGPIIAKCQYKIENKGKSITHNSNDMLPKTFNLNEKEQDSRFETSILEDCNSGCKVSIGIRSYNNYEDYSKSISDEDNLIIIRV